MELLQVRFKNEDIRTFFRVTTHTPHPLFLWVLFANMLQVKCYGQHNHSTEADVSQKVCFFSPQQKKEAGSGV